VDNSGVPLVISTENGGDLDESLVVIVDNVAIGSLDAVVVIETNSSIFKTSSSEDNTVAILLLVVSVDLSDIIVAEVDP